MRRAALLAALFAALPATASASPEISVAIHGPLGDAGWYVGNVIINWSVTDTQAFTVNVGCEPSITLTADTAGTVRECKATSADGTSASKGVLIHLDKTAPSVTPGADRPADGGFFNHSLTATWTGTDATSGIASCTSTPYAGPDGTGISLAGTCRDKAGNVSAPVPFVFNYDATPPTLSHARARPDDRGAKLSWETAGASRVVVARDGKVVYDGADSGFVDKGLKNGKRYAYLVQAFDPAGNVATASLTVRPNAAASSEHLLSPGFQSRVRRPPLLRWRTIRRASYYNVQLFRKGRKVLSAWPGRPHYQLRKVWRYHGRRHRLLPGTYWWYLWAGYGNRSEHRYGKLLGRRSFTVT